MYDDRVIWKYVVLPHGQVSMKHSANILSVMAVGDEIVLWALVSQYEKNVTRQLHVIPTGIPYTPVGDEKFIDTVRFPDNGLVFHVFDHGETGEVTAN